VTALLLRSLVLALVPGIAQASGSVPQEPTVAAVPLEELELAPGEVFPRYGWTPWHRDSDEADLPRAVLDGEGECLFLPPESGAATHQGRPTTPFGELVVRLPAPRDVSGTLFVPRASGGGFTRLSFRFPAERVRLGEEAFLLAELARTTRLLRTEAAGGAWFRHRYEELTRALGERVGPALPGGPPFRPPEDALELFTGARALYENLQLERGLPATTDGEESVPVDTLEGIRVRAYDWKARLGAADPAVDALARAVPADQHALFFPRFQAFDEALEALLGLRGLLGVGLGTDTGVPLRARYETQLCLAVDELARALGPLAIRSVALTGSDPYLDAGTDVAVLLELRADLAPQVHALLRARQQAAGFVLEPDAHGAGTLTRSPDRAVCSHEFFLPRASEDADTEVLVVTNSLVQSERILAAARGEAPALAAADEYRFFRQRYAPGADEEAAFLVLPDAAIRRWCSPRWRIGTARRTAAAAALAEEHARHLDELAAGVEGRRILGVDPDFPDLGVLTLGPDGLLSQRYGTLDFLTPVAELALDRVRPAEVRQYERWRLGFERAWSNFFDPIAARVALEDGRLELDLTVEPLILETQYAELRDATRGPGLGPRDGDPHDSALVRLALAIDPEWEPLQSVGTALGPAAQALGARPLGWLGRWVSVYLDQGPLWEELLEAEDLEEVLSLQDRLDEVPLAVTIDVAKPLELALFLTSLRAFVDGTAPGMTQWRERTVGERRFVEVGSPGLSDSLRLLYATVPGALILSLNESTLLAAMERAEARAAAPAAAPSGDGTHAELALHGPGLRLVELLLGDSLEGELRRRAWSDLPVLNEWQRRFPADDPVQMHARLFRERLACPAGGEYVWNAEWHTMESTVLGHPGAPPAGLHLPPAWSALAAVESRLTFEEDGLRVRLALERE